MTTGNNTHTYAGESSRCIPRRNSDPNALQRWEQLLQGLCAAECVTHPAVLFLQEGMGNGFSKRLI